MRVTDWQKWTHAKKVIMAWCYLLGFPLAVTLYSWVAVTGFALLIVASFIINTIGYDEW